MAGLAAAVNPAAASDPLGTHHQLSPLLRPWDSAPPLSFGESGAEFSLQSPVFRARGAEASNSIGLSFGEEAGAVYVPHEADEHFWIAAGEIALLEFIPWALAKWIREWEDPAKNWANVSSDTWWNNLNKGWEYDGDNFLTNQFSHPYHGAMFFNGARTNGYTFWESVPFALAGSALWEYFGETYRPAFNDWVSTGFTGSYFGEALYRLSVLVTDNTATGSDRVWTEIAGALVNPVRGFTRLVSGEAARVFPNPPEKNPGDYRAVLTAGVRRMDADGTDLIKDAVTQAFASVEFSYGNIYKSPLSTPFSSFLMNVAVALPNRPEDSTGALNRVSVAGVLYGWRLRMDETCRQALTIRGVYDYVSNPAFEFGQTAVAVDFNALRNLSERWQFGLTLGARGILMGGTPSDYYLDVEGRNYDFGPGYGVQTAASLFTGGWDVVSLYYNGGWIWTQSDPSKSKHNFHILTLLGRYPFSDRLAVTLDIGMYWRESYYELEYYNSVDPTPAQPFESKASRRHPVSRLSLAYSL
jgi:hypothetical protein